MAAEEDEWEEGVVVAETKASLDGGSPMSSASDWTIRRGYA